MPDNTSNASSQLLKRENVHSGAWSLDTVATNMSIKHLSSIEIKKYVNSCIIIFSYTKVRRIQISVPTLNQTQSSFRGCSSVLLLLVFRSEFKSEKPAAESLKKKRESTYNRGPGPDGCFVGPSCFKPRRNRGTFWLLSSLWVKDKHRHQYENKDSQCLHQTGCAAGGLGG